MDAVDRRELRQLEHVAILLDPLAVGLSGGRARCGAARDAERAHRRVELAA